jgi:hypothetical protein
VRDSPPDGFVACTIVAASCRVEDNSRRGRGSAFAGLAFVAHSYWVPLDSDFMAHWRRD